MGLVPDKLYEWDPDWTEQYMRMVTKQCAGGILPEKLSLSLALQSASLVLISTRPARDVTFEPHSMPARAAKRS